MGQEIKIKVQISEPWDFDIFEKGNEFVVSVCGFVFSPQNSKNWQDKYILATIDEPFKWRGENVRQILIAPRYRGETIEDIFCGKNIIAGIGRVRQGYNLHPSESFTNEKIEYFAIGSVNIDKEVNKDKKVKS